MFIFLFIFIFVFIFILIFINFLNTIWLYLPSFPSIYYSHIQSNLLISEPFIQFHTFISCRCGRIIVQMARDHDQTRPHIRKALLAQIEMLCNEAVQVHQSLPLYHEPTLESPRIQILQRLTNLCVVLEGMGSEGRRQTNEFMKEILNEETIENLVKAFACTLPASRQLLAQLR